ncbi:MAG: hypothetical protein RRY13_04630 [Akkermansia sp.]
MNATAFFYVFFNKRILRRRDKEALDSILKCRSIPQPKNIMKNLPLIALAITAVTLSSCDNKNNLANTTPPGQENSLAAMQARFAADMVGVQLGKYIPIRDARQIKPGEKATIKASLIGQDNIFEDDLAIFIIGDPAAIKVAPDKPIPWSDKETPPEVVKENTMRVQFVDAQGKPLHASAKGVKGLQELDNVIISGTMDEISTPDAPVLNIDKIIIVPTK